MGFWNPGSYEPYDEPRTWEEYQYQYGIDAEDVGESDPPSTDDERIERTGH
jgi:hypothetical protein